MATAELTGVAAAYAHVRRLDRDQALAELGGVLAGVQPAARQQVLDEAAAGYVPTSSAEAWYPSALQLLVDAGADRERAQEIRADRDGRGGIMRR